MQNKDIEGVQTECQGNGEKFCQFYLAPRKELEGKKLKFQKVDDISELDENDQMYMEMNKIRPTAYATHSLRELIDAEFFKYVEGKVCLGRYIHFSIEMCFFYLLEGELSKLKGGKDLLFDTCFEFGKELVAVGPHTIPFVTDYLSAVGFGDIVYTCEGGKHKIVANYFPWMPISEKADFTIFRGLVSGMLSGTTGKKILLAKKKTETVGQDFSVFLEGS